MPGPASSVTIELPFPPKELSPNSRPNRWEKAKAVREYRTAVGWMAAPTGRYRATLTPPVSAVVTFVVPTRHKRDLDNLLAMLKPAWDGLVDAGVLTGDDSERFSVERATIESRYDEFLRANIREPKVIVELRGGEQKADP